MKKALLLFILVFVLTDTNAQNYKIETGEEYESPRVVWSNTALDPDNTGFYFIRNKNGLSGKIFMLHKIDKSTSKTIYLKEYHFNFDSKNVYNKQGKIYIFNSSENQVALLTSKRTLVITLQLIDSNTGGAIGETLLIDEVHASNE